MSQSWKKFSILLMIAGPCLLPAQDQDGGPAAAASNYINDELPAWMHFSAEERARAEYITGEAFRSVTDRYILNRLQLNLTLDLLNWLKFTFQSQDARVFGQNTLPAPTSQKDAMNLSAGYVQLGTSEGPFTLRAGRQSLDFGDGRLVSDQDWSNVGLAFDVARLTLQHDGSKVDIFTGASVQVNPFGFDLPTPGEHFHGAYGSLDEPILGATLEPYVFWQLEHNWLGSNGNTGRLNEKTIGLRWHGKLPLGLDYTAESAGQVGSAAHCRVGAWMGHWVIGETLPDKHDARLFLEFDRASATFDPLFANPHDQYGLTDLLSATNLVHLRPGVQYPLASKLKISAAFNRFWLASSWDGLYVRGQMLALSATGAAGGSIGSEPDIQAQWMASRSTQLIAGYGRLFPGEFLRRSTSGLPYNLVFLSLRQEF